jgi:hypothetical protein
MSFANRRRISLKVKGISAWSWRVVVAFAGGDDGEDGVGEHDYFVRTLQRRFSPD